MGITYDQWRQNYQGKINPNTGTVWTYGDVAAATRSNPADIERFGLQTQQSAWNQNVAGGGAYAGQPLWKDPYAGGSAYTAVNHTLNGPAGTSSGYVNPQAWRAAQQQTYAPAYNALTSSRTTPDRTYGAQTPSWWQPGWSQYEAPWNAQYLPGSFSNNWQGQSGFLPGPGGRRDTVYTPEMAAAGYYSPEQIQANLQSAGINSGTLLGGSNRFSSPNEGARPTPERGTNPEGSRMMNARSPSTPPWYGGSWDPWYYDPQFGGEYATGGGSYSDPNGAGYDPFWRYIAGYPYQIYGPIGQDNAGTNSGQSSASRDTRSGARQPGSSTGDRNATPPVYNPGVVMPSILGRPNQNVRRSTTGGINPNAGGAPTIRGTTPTDMVLANLRRSAPGLTGGIATGLAGGGTRPYPALTGDAKSQLEQLLKNSAQTANTNLSTIGTNPNAAAMQQWQNWLFSNFPGSQVGSFYDQLGNINQAAGGQYGAGSAQTNNVQNLWNQIQQYGLPGQSNISGLLNNFSNAAMTGGLTPQYSQAMRELVLNPSQEALLGNINQMAGGGALLTSPAYQELLQRNEQQFNNQLLSQGMQNQSALGGLANQMYGNIASSNYPYAALSGNLAQNQQQQGLNALLASAGLGQQGTNQYMNQMLGMLGLQNQAGLGYQGLNSDVLRTMLSGIFGNAASQAQIDAAAKGMWGQIIGGGIQAFPWIWNILTG